MDLFVGTGVVVLAWMAIVTFIHLLSKTSSGDEGVFNKSSDVPITSGYRPMPPQNPARKNNGWWRGGRDPVLYYLYDSVGYDERMEVQWDEVYGILSMKADGSIGMFDVWTLSNPANTNPAEGIKFINFTMSLEVAIPSAMMSALVYWQTVDGGDFRCINADGDRHKIVIFHSSDAYMNACRLLRDMSRNQMSDLIRTITPGRKR